MEQFIQEFRRTARESEYEERPLIEKFKREINKVIRRKLIEAKRPPRNIKQWYERVMSLDRYWRKSRQEENRLRDRRETEVPAQRINTLATAGRAQEQ